MKQVVITGAAGFIGGEAVRHFLQRGWHVIALQHRRTTPEWQRLAREGRIILLQADAADGDSLAGALMPALNARGFPLDAMIHCAGRASDVGRRGDFKRANYQSVLEVASLAMRVQARRFVFVSTTDVYGLRDFQGETEDQLPFDNNRHNPYPEYKIAAEKWLRATLPPERFVIVRPAAVWGVGDPTLTPRAVAFLRASPCIVHFGHWRGANRWPLAHVRNVALGLYLAATRDEVAGQAINILDNEITSIDEFYRIIAELYFPDKQFRRLFLPSGLALPFSAAISAFSNLFNLPHPLCDPSLYALHTISHHLDFSNQRFLSLCVAAGEKLLTREEGIAELRAEMTIHTGSSR